MNWAVLQQPVEVEKLVKIWQWDVGHVGGRSVERSGLRKWTQNQL